MSIEKVKNGEDIDLYAESWSSEDQAQDAEAMGGTTNAIGA